MTNDPNEPPREPSQGTNEGAPEGEPPPFEPDPELIGYWEREQQGAPEQR